MAVVLYRLGQFAYRRRRLVAAFWLGIALAMGIAAAALHGSTSDQFSIPGTESQRALDLLNREFPGTGGADARIVFAAPAGHTLQEKRYQAVVDPTVAAARKVPQTVGGSKAFEGSLKVSADKKVAFADLHFSVPVAKITAQTRDALEKLAIPARTAGLEVEFSGGVVSTVESGSGAVDLVGLIVAFIVLSITFSAFLAAGLPLASALTGVAIGIFGIKTATGIISLNSSAPTLALMLGLAVGIDYALFIVSRFRQFVEEGLPPDEAAPRAIATAGSAVAFAGVTVVIALVGLSVVGIPFLSAMGLAAAATVVIAVLIALTMLPALLGFAGSRAAHRRKKLPAVTFGRRWVTLVTDHPVLALGGVLVVFCVAGAPALHLRQGLPDDRSAPKDTTQRKAYDLLASGFGPGFNGPLTIVIDATGKADPAKVGQQGATLIGKLPDVAAVSAPIPNATGDISIVNATPASSPSSAATASLVKLIRQRAAVVKQQYKVSAYVTGPTAVNIDVSSKLTSALPVFIVLIVGLALLLLIAVFRSLLVPLTAVFGFLLTIGASLGAVTWVFQMGHGLSVLGVDSPGPVVSFLPVLMVSILFGLAMDYEVFLVSRMREAHTHGESAKAATIDGFSASARVVTAAEVIMTSVFAAFLTDPSVVTKSIAFSLTFGILFDAFLVRMTVIPAVHELLGERAWWLPKPLARALPNIDIEGAQLEAVKPLARSL